MAFLLEPTPRKRRVPCARRGLFVLAIPTAGKLPRRKLEHIPTPLRACVPSLGCLHCFARFPIRPLVSMSPRSAGRGLPVRRGDQCRRYRERRRGIYSLGLKLAVYHTSCLRRSIAWFLAFRFASPDFCIFFFVSRSRSSLTFQTSRTFFVEGPMQQLSVASMGSKGCRRAP